MNLQPGMVKDKDWIRQSFLVQAKDLDAVDYQNRTFSSASLKFTDTTPGGNFAINPPAQFTRTADPKATAMFTDPSGSTFERYSMGFAGSKGMGRYYSEAIDDNSQLIHMRFGVPDFNSLTTFFTGFYNTGASQMARTGRATSIAYTLGQAAGFIVSILSWKLLAVHLIGVAARFFLAKPSSKFYYLKPTMPLYWNAVQTMVNQILVNRGVIPRIGGSDQSALGGGNGSGGGSDAYQFDAAAIQTLNQQLPTIFKLGGGIDVYSLAGRAQRLARARHKEIEQALDNGTDLRLANNMGELSTFIQAAVKKELKIATPIFKSYLASWAGGTDGHGVVQAGTNQARPDPASSGADSESLPVAPSTAAPDPTKAADNTQSKQADANTADEGFMNFFMNELDDGSAFVTFRVDATGHVDNSYSNQVGESELSQKINSMSASSRSTRFSFAGGNLDDGIVGKAVGEIAGAIGDFASGAAAGLGISGIAALGGSAFVDIPKYWQQSVASLPRASYTIQLRSPYGNPISQMINLYIPLCMLLAGALPLSTGKQSYTSPFLCELYDKGRCQVRLGMIDSLSITRGTGNLGFNTDGHAMGIDISFSVVDMSSIMTMPISQGFSMTSLASGAVKSATDAAASGVTKISGAGAGIIEAGGTAIASIGATFDDDNTFSDYMAVLAGMSLSDQIYQLKKLKLNLTRNLANWNSWNSASHYASFAGDTLPARLISGLFKGTARGGVSN